MIADDREQLAHEVARYAWYHTLELADGVVTSGMFDHRSALQHYMLPDQLAGMRCLDVGTRDGFWAFEMEHRGAREVVALDVASVEDLDWPSRWRTRVEPTLDETKQARFELARTALGSRVQRVERSVYELDTDLGQFDMVFCGDLLVHLKDPVSAIQGIRRVCRRSAIIANPVKRFRLARRRPLAEFDGIDEFQWWLLSEAALERMMLAAGFARVEIGKSFALPPAAGGPWSGTRAVMRGFVE